MIGIGGLCGMFFVLNVWSSILFNHLITSILLAGSVGFARLYLKAHTPMQILLGFLLGFFSISIYVFIW
jgi:membrane-associated phospholipid phosphatase